MGDRVKSSGPRRPKPNAPAGKGGLRPYGRHRKAQDLEGHSHAAVQRSIDSGRIDPPDPKTGWLDFAAADRQWSDRTDPRLGHSSQEPSGNGIERLPLLPDGTPDFALLGPHQAHRAEASYWRARRLRQEFLIRDGSLLVAADIERVSFEYWRALRDQLLAIPSRIAHELAHATSVHECRQIVDGVLREVLSEPALPLHGKEVDKDAA